MSRLDDERRRLYLLPEGAPADTQRALVLELGRPSDWSRLGRVWRAVQADLGLSAPAIAVSGDDALQLWFSLAEPVEAGRGAAFLDGLRQRYLADVPAHRLACTPPAPLPEVPVLRGREPGDGERWSAFVAPDLAPLFDDTPWLDIPPGDEAQAQLLAALAPMAPAAFEAALRLLAPAPGSGVAAAPIPAPAPAPAPARTPAPDGPSPVAETDDPRAFLVAVMNDAAVPLALRIEAARALLAAR